MDEIEGRPENDGPRDEARRADQPGDAQPGAGPRPFQQGGDFRPRRRGRRGRGGGQRFGGQPRGPMTPRADDEESSQARELAAYERRQQQQRGRTTPFRGPGWVAGQRPQTPAFRPQGGGFRPPSPGGFRGPRPIGGARGPRRVGGQSYSEQIRRVTAGPRAEAAPSHEAGEPIAGPHAVLEAIRAGRQVRRLFISNERGTRTGPVNELIEEAQQRRIFVRYVEPMEISRLSPIESHQGVVAIVAGKAGVELDEFLAHLDAETDHPSLVLVIDSLQDPQNFGVLLRSAEGTGVDGVVIPKHHSVGLTPAVTKTSAGASEHLMLAEVANLRQAIDALKEKGIWVVATDETGDLLYDEVDYRGPTAIVIGGEGEGIRRLVLEGCDQVVRIPMEGQISSLNAAAAGTVVLYEALRQRRRNVAPADTRTPPPARPAAVTPQEESMDGEDLAEEAADRVEGAADVQVDEASDAAGENLDVIEANDGEALPIAPAEESAAAADRAIKKPAPARAKKTTRKTTRKKTAE